ncbi:MAG: hypothetical protein JKY95_12975 [Planctomycetaceae bacterium]|nr:hypothetical protein [Planctomycetaceae bacterium]
MVKKRKRQTPEQIVKKLRDSEAMLNAGQELAVVLQTMEVSESTWERWRNQYGGMIEPQVGFVRDSFVSMAYALDGLASRGGTLSQWVQSIPSYAIVKSKLTCPQNAVQDACRALKKNYPDATPTEGAGLRLDWDNRWVQVRASNTEPIIRVIAEAPEATEAEALCSQAKQSINQALGL